jgi:hypothetical protein
MIGFKGAEGSCSNMLLSTKELPGQRFDNQKLNLPWQYRACSHLVRLSMNMFVYLFTVFYIS